MPYNGESYSCGFDEDRHRPGIAGRPRRDRTTNKAQRRARRKGRR